MRLCERLCTIHEAEKARLLFTKCQNSIQSAWAQSNTFCACLEGAYIIAKTINVLHDRVSSLMHGNRVARSNTYLFFNDFRLLTLENTQFSDAFYF